MTAAHLNPAYIVAILVSVTAVAEAQVSACSTRQSCPAMQLLTRFEGWDLMYQLGPVGVYTHDTQSYAGFTKSGVDNILRTNSFELHAGDTLAAYRFAAFGRRDADFSNAAPGAEYPVTVADLPEGDVVNCVLELRRAGSGNVLWSGDTLQVYRDNAGLLKYRNLPEGWNRVLLLPRQEQLGSVYLTARITASGKLTARSYRSFASEGYTYFNHVMRSIATNQVSPPIGHAAKQ